MTLPKTFALYYYQLVIAYCNGDQSSSKHWLSLLEQSAKEDASLIDSLPTPHVEYLRKLRKSIRSDWFLKSLESPTGEDQVDAIAVDRSKCLEPEKVLQRRIGEECVARIAEISGLQGLRLNSIEHPLEHGICDLVFRNDDTIVPTEVKSLYAKHDVVSQIDKYIKSFTKDFIKQLWNRVIGVVIANGFSQYAVQEMRTMGVIAIRYQFKDNQISLEHVA